MMSPDDSSHVNFTTTTRRRRLLNTGLKDDTDIASRVKVTSAELKVIVGHASRMIEQFYPDHVLARSSKPIEEFWESRGLVQLDWNGLFWKFTHLKINTSCVKMNKNSALNCF